MDKPLRWKRLAAGSYESDDGLISIYRSSTRYANNLGLASPWTIERMRGPSASAGSFREAKQKAESMRRTT